MRAQKIDSTILETYEMVVFTFSVIDKDNRERFCEESFLLADVKPDIMLGIPFLIICNANIDLQARNLQWRFYTTRDILSTTWQVELIEKKEFVVVALTLEHEAFVVHVAALNVNLGDEVHPSKRALIAHLKVDEASFEVPSKYVNFPDVFAPKLVVKLLEYTRINDNAIQWVDDRPAPYGPIYSLRFIELETLKTYIKNNLANGFIKSSKSPAGVSILFDKKPDGSLRLYIDYRYLNNLTIKNQYPLTLVRESLDWLSQTWHFT